MSQTESLAKVDDVLEHFGIKGMKWGVRKAARRSPGSEDAQRAVEAKKKIKAGGGTKALSNKELQDLVTRMNLEQQYSNLTGNKQSKIKIGQKAAKEILGIGKTVNEAMSFVNSPAGKLLKEQLATATKKK